MRETWYVLSDGRCVHPADVIADAGRLVASDGVPVAMRSPDVPMSRSVDPDEQRARYATREMTAAVAPPGTKTRKAP